MLARDHEPLLEAAFEGLKEAIAQIDPLIEAVNAVKTALDGMPKGRHIRDRELAKLMFRRIISLSDQIIMLDSDELMTSQKLAANISKMARETLKVLCVEEGGGDCGHEVGMDWRIIEGRCAEPDHGEIPGGPDYKGL